MRRQFHPLLLDHMRRDPRIIVILGDLGFGMFDSIIAELPDRCINVGAREQAMLGIGVGLALKGKIPVLYSITPFLLWRAAEWVRTYAQNERIAIKLCGAGRGQDYSHDGWTHDASDDAAFIRLFSAIQPYWPETIEELPTTVESWLYNGSPSYLNLKR